MTINEFKAWLEGFNENVGTHPTADQWRKIKAKINQLSTSKEKAFDVSEWTKKYNRDYYLGENTMILK